MHDAPAVLLFFEAVSTGLARAKAHNKAYVAIDLIVTDKSRTNEVKARERFGFVNPQNSVLKREESKVAAC